MNKYKIYVYAISKNEAKFAQRWCDSMQEADAIYVLDTGSTDDTVKILEKNNVHVKIEKITPWRFDTARNKSLNMVPKDADICVCTDLDEVLEKGWRKKLEKIWNKDTTRLKYNYNWSFDKYGNPAVNFYNEKIHKREGYKWIHPVHEVLVYNKEERTITTDEITLNHYPDTSKSRTAYLPLLELSVKEDPEDDRNMHYLGREYMYHEKYDKAIETLKKHLTLKKATWKDERAASMRYIARCYEYQGKINDAAIWYQKSIKEAPYLREAYTEFAFLEYRNKHYNKVIELVNLALNINEKYKNYITEPYCYDGTLYDLLSMCLYEKGRIKEAYFYTTIALKYAKDDERLKNNKEYFEKLIKNATP